MSHNNIHRVMLTVRTCNAHVKSYAPIGHIPSESRLCNTPLVFHREPSIAALSGEVSHRTAWISNGKAQ